ncbi:hypothetical protein NPIL_71491 [Nephila pilipes]|uniref:Uncharacterized protein n=1 Tax=Nephila pilipes TaxID=299642 RepID=A0A8X6TV95_NEPPI|nr:hypothetical protein NPIL_71491 [Nephila pilipes]
MTSQTTGFHIPIYDKYFLPPRKENITADSLSRIASIEMPNPINYDEIAKSQELDLELQNLISNPHGLQLKKIVMPNFNILLRFIYRNSLYPKGIPPADFLSIA